MKTVKTMMSNSNVVATLKGKGLDLVLVSSKYADVSSVLFGAKKSIIVFASIEKEINEIQFEITNQEINEDCVDVKTTLQNSDLDIFEFGNRIGGSVELTNLKKDNDFNHDSIFDNVVLNINEKEVDNDIDNLIDLKYKNILLCNLYKEICEGLNYLENENIILTQKYINERF